ARAGAGRGLTAIEPGMPVPAGTGLDRRSFVSGVFGLALSVYGLGKLNLFDEGIAHAATRPSQPVLVSVFLPGGADSLSVLAPVLDPNYRKLRPTLALPADRGPSHPPTPTSRTSPRATSGRSARPRLA